VTGKYGKKKKVGRSKADRVLNFFSADKSCDRAQQPGSLVHVPGLPPQSSPFIVWSSRACRVSVGASE
jgi:hypothetical protein